MNDTVQTHTENDLQQHIDAALDAAWETLKQRELIAERNRLEAAAEAEFMLRQKWEPTLDAIRQRLPDWVRPYLKQPDVQPSDYTDARGHAYAPVMIAIPGCTPIAAWALGNGITFEASAPILCEDEDTGTNYVHVSPAFARRTWWDTAHSDPNFAVALLTARQQYESQQRLQAQADDFNQVNAEGTLYIPDPDPEPQPPAEPTAAQKRAAMLADTATAIASFAEADWLITRENRGSDGQPDDYADDRAVLLATVGLTIAAQLARIADVLEASRG